MSWFRSKTNGMPNLGQGDGWTPAEWRRAPRRRVAIDKLISTNRGGYLSQGRAAKYAKRGGGADPYVVQDGSHYYVADGHHRVVAAMMRGETSIAVRVMRAGAR